jgi:hypothetical protein
MCQSPPKCRWGVGRKWDHLRFGVGCKSFDHKVGFLAWVLTARHQNVPSGANHKPCKYLTCLNARSLHLLLLRWQGADGREGGILLGRLETFAESRRAVLGRSLSVTVKFKAHSKCFALRFEPSHHRPRGNFLQPHPFFTAVHANAREFVTWTSSIGKFHLNHPTDLCKLTFLVTVASVRAHHTVHHKTCVSSHWYYHIFTMPSKCIGQCGRPVRYKGLACRACKGQGIA